MNKPTKADLAQLFFDGLEQNLSQRAAAILHQYRRLPRMTSRSNKFNSYPLNGELQTPDDAILPLSEGLKVTVGFNHMRWGGNNTHTVLLVPSDGRVHLVSINSLQSEMKLPGCRFLYDTVKKRTRQRLIDWGLVNPSLHKDIHDAAMLFLRDMNGACSTYVHMWEYIQINKIVL